MAATPRARRAWLDASPGRGDARGPNSPPGDPGFLARELDKPRLVDSGFLQREMEKPSPPPSSGTVKRAAIRAASTVSPPVSFFPALEWAGERVESVLGRPDEAIERAREGLRPVRGRPLESAARGMAWAALGVARGAYDTLTFPVRPRLWEETAKLLFGAVTKPRETARQLFGSPLRALDTAAQLAGGLLAGAAVHGIARAERTVVREGTRVTVAELAEKTGEVRVPEQPARAGAKLTRVVGELLGSGEKPKPRLDLKPRTERIVAVEEARVRQVVKKPLLGGGERVVAESPLERRLTVAARRLEQTPTGARETRILVRRIEPELGEPATRFLGEERALEARPEIMEPELLGEEKPRTGPGKRVLEARTEKFLGRAEEARPASGRARLVLEERSAAEERLARVAEEALGRAEEALAKAKRPVPAVEARALAVTLSPVLRLPVGARAGRRRAPAAAPPKPVALVLAGLDTAIAGGKVRSRVREARLVPPAMPPATVPRPRFGRLVEGWFTLQSGRATGGSSRAAPAVEGGVSLAASASPPPSLPPSLWVLGGGRPGRVRVKNVGRRQARRGREEGVKRVARYVKIWQVARDILGV